MQGNTFVGALPKPLLEMLLRTCKPELWPAVFVGCSGTFRTERALLSARPALVVHGNDVSLFSTAVAHLALGEPLDFRFSGELTFVEDLRLDPAGRVAAVIVATSMGQHASGKPNRFKRAHLDHYRANFAGYVERTAAKLAKIREELPLASYTAGDFVDHMDRAIEAGAGFVSYPPTFKGGYEKLFAFVNRNTDWQEPAYRPFDPSDLPALIDKIDAAGTPYFICCDQAIEGRQPVGEVALSGKRTVFAYARSDRSGYHRAGYREDRFTYRALDIGKLTKRSVVTVLPSNANRLNFLKNVYLKKSIVHVSGQGSFEVYIDGMLVGGLILSTSKFGRRQELYLLSDFSTTRSGRVAKLIARLATSREVIRHLDLTFVEHHTDIVTTAFSDHPAAMKYRGSWDLRSREPGPPDGPKFILNYASPVRAETLAQAYAWWWDRDGKSEVAAAQDRVPPG